MKSGCSILISVLPALIGLRVLALPADWQQDVEVSVHDTGSFTDERDGRMYRTVRIGEQWIMAENLAYKPAQGNCWTYNDDTALVSKYGYLYDWETAKHVAPKGWHLPSATEWQNLRKSLGGKRDVYKRLGGTMEIVYKEMVVGGCGFNALLCGIRQENGTFVQLGSRTDFWSSSASKSGQYFYTLDANKDSKRRSFLDSKEGTAALADQQNSAQGGKSVRLFKD
jgi:uncharacterized protein (TIGR02145 family)